MIYRCDFELYLVSGPSFAIDTACSSSMYALEHAYRAMRNGQCDSAIVGGSNLCLHPVSSFSLFRFGILSPQGICRSFDRDGMHLSSVRYDMCMLIIMNLVVNLVLMYVNWQDVD
jgi:acyl transferase domain-containing protein